MRVKNILISLAIMGMVSLACLLIVSALTYLFKWQAGKAMIGITFTYILAGFIGGWVKRGISGESNITRKLLDGIILGTVFMAILMILSIVIMGNPFAISGRVLMIWMLLVGSACLGRIL